VTRPALGERLELARLGWRRARAALAARSPLAPVFGRRLVRPIADELLFVPSDLRPADPGLLDELAAGQLGLAGLAYEVGAGSPFALAGIDQSWQRELNGFAWLGGLRAAGRPEAAAVARRLVADWCRRQRGRPGGAAVAAEPEVTARRVVAWIVNAGLLLEGAEPEFHQLLTRTLGAELRALDRAAPLAPPGLPRLVCLLALVLACLAVAGHDRDRSRIEARLVAELAHQILPDGGHVSRNADAVVEALLDLLPVRQCYAARGLEPPPTLVEASTRMLAFVRSASTTTRALARFNGVGQPRADTLATVLSLEATASTPATGLGASGYARLVRGATTLTADCAPPPPLEHATAAHAGCLSFELAHANHAVIVNRGAPGPAHRRLQPDARATASHSTLTVADQSSARLIPAPRLARFAGGPPIRGPARVEAAVTEGGAGEARLLASHDGYLARFGLMHERRLDLAADGLSLAGLDRLRPPRGTLRLARDLPFAVHFHVPPDAEALGEASGVLIRLAAPDAGTWRLTASGCHVSIEGATDYAEVLGPVPARQVVLRAACPGEAEIAWRLARA
jgi:uncharacterized heparinase superfamily protein